MCVCLQKRQFGLSKTREETPDHHWNITADRTVMSEPILSTEMFMEGPACLISTDSEGKMCVQKEAKDILDGINNPVVVVSVVGLYRTGKSYLMNRLAGHQRGFALGNTIESKTKGIWMWCVPHPLKKEYTLVLLDTEGLGDIDKGDEKHDSWIFCLAVLLSSTLVYNSLVVIDNTALEKLHYVTELTENIRVKAKKGKDEDESAEFMRLFPSFIWCVRDFTLKLEKDGREITADQYLETALELKPGCSAKVNNFNLPRSCLRNFFAERRCFVFRRPAVDENLRRMEELTEEELEPEFLKQTQEFCDYVFSSTKPKTVTGGRTLTGAVLGSLAEVYVEAIRMGGVPCLENAVEALARIQNGRAVEKAMQAYLTEALASTCFPLAPAELSNIHMQAEKKALEVFISMSFNDAQQAAQLDLMRKIQTKYETFCSQNQNECKTECSEELKKVFAPLEDHLRDGTFMLPGGYQNYQDTIQHLTAEYRKHTNTLFMCEEVLTEYLKEKDEQGRSILAADQHLTLAEQKMKEECLKREALEQKQRALEEQNQQQEQMFHDQERTYKQHMTQILERLKREREQAREENQQVLDAKLKEQKALLEEGFMEKADLLQKEISSLKQEMDDEESKRNDLTQVVDTVGQAIALFLPGFASKALGIGTSMVARML